jgi:hypothetical protein
MAKDGVFELEDREAWAWEQFGAANLGDVRRTKRVVKLAVQMAGNSSGSIPQQTGKTADMKAAYRLFAAGDVTHEAICRPHFEQTRAAAGRLPLVYLIQDTAQLNFTSHPRCEGLGPIGRGDMRGLHQQNVLAVDSLTRRPLGLMYQKHPQRAQRSSKHDRQAKHRVPLAQRESYWWVEAIDDIGPPSPGARWVHVGDRAEDVFGVYDACRRHEADWLIRAAYDRKIQTQSESKRLMDHARSLIPVVTHRLTVRDRSMRTIREAVLSVAGTTVTLQPSQREPEYRHREPIECGVVRVWEADPPQGVTPLEWILLTSLPHETGEEVLAIAEGYALRWIIEEFHKCEKTGCQVEARQLTHIDRLEPLIGLLSVLAVCLLKLKFVARDEPEQPATELFDEQTIEVMARYLKRPVAGMTVRMFWRGIGRLGGHPGRKGDGPVGWLRAWRGWQSFQLILLGASLSGTKGERKCG